MKSPHSKCYPAALGLLDPGRFFCAYGMSFIRSEHGGAGMNDTFWIVRFLNMDTDDLGAGLSLRRCEFSEVKFFSALLDDEPIETFR